ncbi:protein of unknown function [Magnetospirillum gryphiswaldense MSR-1 v2]|uniref:Uncharacterized protein n=1 Tax=Magnetospirillum gryphiswaldense (strain DSM 6361 / JCM 21280 / NBRC 15271 / MSR-1) TaxID=431944 RepID=V6F1Y2_MAGGM|nr:protein of unknown function [Magnetospirillum gryphiswaldense MSR-1 v2]
MFLMSAHRTEWLIAFLACGAIHNSQSKRCSFFVRKVSAQTFNNILPLPYLTVCAIADFILVSVFLLKYRFVGNFI